MKQTLNQVDILRMMLSYGVERRNGLPSTQNLYQKYPRTQHGESESGDCAGGKPKDISSRPRATVVWPGTITAILVMSTRIKVAMVAAPLAGRWECSRIRVILTEMATITRPARAAAALVVAEKKLIQFPAWNAIMLIAYSTNPDAEISFWRQRRGRFG